jgi:FkbM family methyltransferase
MLYDSRYELRFAKELMQSVSPGDCVWDIGANVGYFTRQLAGRVTSSGCVIAFEPFRSSFDRLLLETREFPQVRCLQLALGANERDLFVGGIPESPSNNLLQQVEPGTGEQVHITTGDRLLLNGHPPPHVMKIDVEGFEEDVLWGFREQLRDSCCSTILIEIHYSITEQRGFLRTPTRIRLLLRDLGFHTCWLDASHLKAFRPRNSNTSHTTI